MAIASQIVKMVGGVMQFGGALAQGIAAEDAAKFEVKQMRRNAVAMDAQGQRSARAEKKEGALLSSNAVAQMAAGGGGVDEKFLADIENKADYNALVALHESKTQSDLMRDAARLRLQQGKSEKRNSRLSAFGGMLSGATGSMSSIAAQNQYDKAQGTKTPADKTTGTRTKAPVYSITPTRAG